MNANDFVLVPNSKAKSVKLNARNLQDLQKETGTLANRSKEMEEKLQQLKESMNKEKGERRYSEGFKWTSGQCGSQINSSKTNREDKLQKLLAGKVKIRVLKDSTAQLPTAPPQPGPRKSRLQGTICGQCEVKKAGVICKECTENFCIGCFVKFHQKGALKLHTMVPIQADLHTNVSTRDVASHIQKTINPSSDHCDIANPHSSPSMAPSSNRSITPNAITREEDEDPEERREAKDNHMILHCDSSQALVGVHGFKKAEMMIGNNEQTSPSGLLGREYDEEVSASSFQEALRMWRGEKDGRGGENMTAIRTPSRPASVSNMMTQADLHPDTGAQGQRREERGRRVPVRLKFTRNNLTYLDRLCLKKSRRTPIQAYEPSVACSAGVEPPPTATAEEETTSHLTVEEEDFRRYCASLFDVPVTEDRTEPQTTRRCELYLAIDVLDETSTDVKQACDTEQKTESDQEVPSDQVFTRRETPLLPQVPSSSSGPSGVSRSSPGQKQPVRPSQTPVQPKTVRLSKSKPSACSTSEASGTSKASIRTPTSKSKANHGSPQFLSSLPHSRPAFPKPCHSALQFSADVLASANNKSAIPKNNLSHSTSTSLSLRSTFTASPLGSTESTLLPKVDHSALLQKHSDSSFLPERPQSSQLPAKPSSSPRQCGSPRDNVVCPPQSRHSLCDHEPLQLDKQFQMSLSPVSAGLDSPPKSLELSLSQQEKEPKRKDGKSSSRLYMFSASPSEEAHVCCSTPTGEEAPAFMSPPSESGGHISPQLHWDAHSILMPSSHLLNVNLSASLAVKMEEEVEQSIDSRDEMSIDSLGLAPDEDSSEEEVLIQEYPRREGTREEQEEPATSHCEDSFVPTESASESEDIFQTDKPELLSETSMVMHNQGAGPGSQHFCDLNGLSPLGLDVKAGDFHTPGRTHCDPLHTCQSSLCDSDQTGSESWGSRGGFQNCTDEHLTSKNTQPTGCKAHSARRQETQLNVQEEFEFDPASRALSRAAREIMEICTVDQAGCEDPDIDTDTTAHMLHGLEHELRLWAEAPEAVVFRMEESANQGQCGNHRVLRGKSGDEEVEEGEKEQEEATAREDQLCVLLLP